jgi:PPM family protein phosphatase
MRVAAGGATDAGRVRPDNQDAYVVGDALFAVCDGVGGHRGGQVASRTAIDALTESFETPTLDGLVSAVLEANAKVWEQAQADPDLRGMASTLTAIAVIGDDSDETGARLAVANVGDSRAYLVRDGELGQISEDHSLVEELVREGRLTRAEADVHPQRSLITRALGLEAEVTVDGWEIIPYEGDRYLLCSDGLTNEVSEDRIAATLRRLADPTEAARELVRLAKEAGGHDNITVVVVDVVDDDSAAERASAALAAEPRSTRSRRGNRRAERDATGRGSQQERETDADADAAAAAEAKRPRRVTWRMVVFTVALLAVLGTAAGAIGWYARSTYYVGIDGDQVGIYRGRPGGLLWFDPTLEEPTTLRVGEVPAARRPDLEAGREFTSLAAAQRYVQNLIDEATRAQVTTTTTTAPPAPPVTTAAPTPP